MTCRQMGGPCDTPFQGDTADEIMNKGIQHLEEIQDEAHKKAQKMMMDAQKNPEEVKKWYEGFREEFEKLRRIEAHRTRPKSPKEGLINLGKDKDRSL